MNHRSSIAGRAREHHAAVLIVLIVPLSFLFSDTALSQVSYSATVQAFDRARSAQSQLDDYRRWEASRRLGTQRPEIAVSIANSIKSISTIFFSDDAEGGNIGWTEETYTDSASPWHITMRDANSLSHSWWAGLEIPGNYNTGRRVKESLVSPSVDLTSAAGPVTLLCTETYVTEKAYDCCMVDVSSDGGTSWTHLRGGYGDAPSGNSYGWKVTTLDLSAYAGSQIKVRFLFDTGDSLFNDFPGWFVDNVAIYDQAGTVSGTVYLDSDSSGNRSGSDVGLIDWFVTATGPIAVTTRTDLFGQFNIPLPLGSYTVTEALQSGWVQTAPPTSSWNVALTFPGQVEDSIDFGNYRLHSFIRGSVFEDLNHNGARDSGEAPLGAWDIRLLDSSGYWMTTAYSNFSGEFGFLIYTAGWYTVLEELNIGWISTLPGGDPPQYLVHLPALDSSVSGLEFGNYHIPQNGGISGSIFNDLNQNGVPDHSEPMVEGRIIELTGPEHLYEVTDSLGYFSFRNLIAGTYLVRLSAHYAWVQTYPESTYTISLAESEVRDSLLFGTYKLQLGSISGSAFHDLNRNSVRDLTEPALAGWMISSSGPEPWTIQATTDSAGRYILPDLLPGLHVLEQTLPGHWAQSLPLAGYAITLAYLEHRDSIDFGAFERQPGSISGTVYNDLNNNTIRDAGEPPLSGWELELDGGTIRTVTDDSGSYRFDALWPASYQLTVVPKLHWRQTFPEFFQPHFITLGTEEHRSAVDFGYIHDSSFSISFRTFLPESIALARDPRGRHKPALLKSDRCQWSTVDIRPSDYGMTDSINLLILQMTKRPDRPSVQTTRGQVVSVDGYYVQIGFNPFLQPDETVTVSGFALKTTQEHVRRWWMWTLAGQGPTMRSDLVAWSRQTLPMPNAINMLSAGVGTGLRVGLGGAHSVVHKSYKDVMKSLVERFDRMHMGDPTCLGVYAYNINRSIKKQVSYLSPRKSNNKLLAEAVALKANIRASELWITPPSFGYLVFQDDSANRFNGLSIYHIASSLDTAMTAFDEMTRTCDADVSYFEELYRTVRMINAAFSGPVDTISFGHGLVFTPARALADVPYLRLDSSFAFMGSASAPIVVATDVPETYVLAQNFPNPFNPSTTIRFTLAQPSRVSVVVYNIIGQSVATLLDHEMLEDGEEEVEFDATALPSGVYFYRLVAEGLSDEEDAFVPTSFSSVRKMLLVK